MGDGVGAKVGVAVKVSVGVSVGVEVAVGAGFVGVGVGERGKVQATKVIVTTSKAIVAAFVKFSTHLQEATRASPTPLTA